MKHLLTILFLIPASLYAQDKVKFVAGGLTCSMCSNAVHKSLKQDKSIKEINPNLQTQVWSAEYKRGEFDLNRLKKGIEDAGFSLEKVWKNDTLIYEKKFYKKR